MIAISPILPPLSPLQERRRILRSACRKAMAIEQRHWPRNPEDIARTIRVHAFAEKHNAWDRGGK